MRRDAGHAALLVMVALATACVPPPRTPAASPRAEDDGQASTTSATPKEGEEPRGGFDPDAADPNAEPIPTTCAASDVAATGAATAAPCVPDAGWVKRLCSGSFPDVALVLMGKAAPFTHMYMSGDVDGWNADGGASPRARLAFDEEVLVLRRRAPAAGIVVGSGAAFLVMRWDGNCYTLEENELTARKPPAVKHGPIPWRLYSDRTKDTLLKSPKVLAAFQKRGKECKGASSGNVPIACEQATTALSAAVVEEVRTGTTIPTPEWHP